MNQPWSAQLPGALMQTPAGAASCCCLLWGEPLLAEKPIETPDELYDWLSGIEWEDLIPADGFFSVTSRINHQSINNSRIECRLLEYELYEGSR